MLLGEVKRRKANHQRRAPQQASFSALEGAKRRKAHRLKPQAGEADNPIGVWRMPRAPGCKRQAGFIRFFQSDQVLGGSPAARSKEGGSDAGKLVNWLLAHSNIFKEAGRVMLVN